MAYTPPTVEQLQARYPAFAAVADETIQVWLTNAESFVDESWAEGDYAPAIMAHAAHNMMLLSIGAHSAAGSLPAGVTRFKSGVVDVTISESAASITSKGGYPSTVYGREFRALLRRNFAGPSAIRAGTVPTCGDRAL